MEHTRPARRLPWARPSSGQGAAGGRWWAALPLLFGRRWWRATLLVLAAMAVMGRLCVWQLDRLEQRRARNAEIARELALPPLVLGTDPLPADPAEIPFRRATASGEFDLSRQVAIKLQNFGASAGIHLVAPLLLDGTAQAVLVDRGWIPDDLAALDQWAQFDQPGRVTVMGYLRPAETLRRPAAVAGTPGPRREWYRVDITAIQAQMPYELLPVYLLQSPGQAGNVALPYRADPEFDLSDGTHLGWATQWAAFALILFAMYVSYVRKH